MKVRLFKNSLRPRARMIGIVYLLYFLAAILAQLLTSRNHVGYGNGANFIATGLYCLVTLLFYYLFKPVSRMLSLVAAFFSLAGCIVMTLELFRPTSLSTNPLLFFGPYCLLIGYLIFKSTFLPRILGVLMALAGAGWLVFLIPNLPSYLSLSLEGLGICAEASLMIWLIVRGVNIERWKQQAGAA
jgi:riboflavin transporter FmnP